MNTIATVILYFLVALFVLHLVQGDAGDWVMSKFKTIVPEGSGTQSTLNPGADRHGTAGGDPLTPTSPFPDRHGSVG